MPIFDSELQCGSTPRTYQDLNTALAGNCTCQGGCEGSCCSCSSSGSGGVQGISVFITEQSGVAAGQPVLFNRVQSCNTSAVSYDPMTGIFQICRPGGYFAVWSLSLLQSGLDPQVELILNLSGTTVGNSAAYVARGQISGSSLFWVSSVPAELRLITQKEIRYDPANAVSGTFTLVAGC